MILLVGLANVIEPARASRPTTRPCREAASTVAPSRRQRRGRSAGRCRASCPTCPPNDPATAARQLRFARPMQASLSGSPLLAAAAGRWRARSRCWALAGERLPGLRSGCSRRCRSTGAEAHADCAMAGRREGRRTGRARRSRRDYRREAARYARRRRALARIERLAAGAAARAGAGGERRARRLGARRRAAAAVRRPDADRRFALPHRRQAPAAGRGAAVADPRALGARTAVRRGAAGEGERTARIGGRAVAGAPRRGISSAGPARQLQLSADGGLIADCADRARAAC